MPAKVQTHELTDLRCRKAAPKQKPYRIADRGGLGLLIMQTGESFGAWLTASMER